MRTIGNEKDLAEAMAGARLAGVVAAWATEGLFDELADGEPRSLASLSGDERAVRITARILANAGLLVRRGDRWTLSPNGAKLHDEGVLSTYRNLEYFRNLAQLDDILTEGGPVIDEEGEEGDTEIGAEPDDPEQTKKFQEMLYRRSARSARATAGWIDRDLQAGSTVLDLGGGHGRYGLELVDRGHDVTLFDLPVTIEISREMHGDRLEYREGDFFEDDLDGPYDAVLASNIVHGLSAEKNAELVDRVADVLAPGGIFVVKDMLYDEFGAWPPTAAYFGLRMLMDTRAGDTYSLDEVSGWFEEAGLEVEEPVVFESFALAIGRRPA